MKISTSSIFLFLFSLRSLLLIFCFSGSVLHRDLRSGTKIFYLFFFLLLWSLLLMLLFFYGFVFAEKGGIQLGIWIRNWYKTSTSYYFFFFLLILFGFIFLQVICQKRSMLRQLYCYTISWLKILLRNNGY